MEIAHFCGAWSSHTVGLHLCEFTLCLNIDEINALRLLVMIGVQMLILPCKCNHSLIWKETKKRNKVIIPNQPLQEMVARLEHLHAPTADLAFAT